MNFTTKLVGVCTTYNNAHIMGNNMYMYHFLCVDQREKQGYKSDVSLKRGTQIICTLENDAMHSLYRHNKTVAQGLRAYISGKSREHMLQLLHK